MLRFAHLEAEADTLAISSYRDDSYISLSLGVYGSIFNSLQLNQNARIARVLIEDLLLMIKRFGELSARLGLDEDLKISLQVPYKSFLDEYATPELESVELYIPGATSDFSRDAITSQELVDSSVILVNEVRVSVPLAAE